MDNTNNKYILISGLFHKAISQSGTNLNPWSQPAHEGVAAKRAVQLGNMVGCSTPENDWSGLIKCLRTVSADEITKQVYNFFVSIYNVIIISVNYFSILYFYFCCL